MLISSCGTRNLEGIFTEAGENIYKRGPFLLSRRETPSGTSWVITREGSNFDIHLYEAEDCKAAEIGEDTIFHPVAGLPPAPKVTKTRYEEKKTPDIVSLFIANEKRSTWKAGQKIKFWSREENIWMDADVGVVATPRDYYNKVSRYFFIYREGLKPRYCFAESGLIQLQHMGLKSPKVRGEVLYFDRVDTMWKIAKIKELLGDGMIVIQMDAESVIIDSTSLSLRPLTKGNK